ncbi:uncharacterized protein HMPREF1541_08560 [Cyphellophora europaea CBS 101466]|uniref:Heme peroxidase n=1 Tax=Cyphellophora europaea (strain CBS 101466) TaxID=1220924 RepID=W2RKP0_CYPE1|nr:uncharacterized protein HMPREF1541_08560 [Cyphellophora europaea CBS 101466]ETN36283.1 hypothetical protein HMPREF1541_08560 [Cyphellophora europaea CBS 101466]
MADQKPSANGVASPNTATIPSGTNKKSESQVLDALKAVNARNIDTLADVALHGLEGGPIDDKTYLMERIIQLTAELPLHDRVSDSLTNSLLTQLWNDLEHPPKRALGFDFAFRKPDGSNNNMMFPHVGKAGQPYAKTVQSTRMRPTSLPDPGVVFDSVLARKDYKPHPNGISSVLFYLASIIIHDCFHTSHDDFAISETSSYLDLAPLYGSNEEQQRSVRTLKDGKIKPDCFSDKRILGFPPGVACFLIMFNRFHNHVVANIAKIDEGGRFSHIRSGRSGFKGTPKKDGAMPSPEELYDEALFQTGRLVTTGLYANIILKDYVRTILGLNQVDTLWNLDPRSDEGKAIFGKKIPEAMGNQCSAEFNLVYRWHSCVSERDAKWTEDVLKAMGQGKVPEGRDFVEALKVWGDKIPADPAARTFEGLKRQSDGSFSDDDLAEIWAASVDDVAGSFGAAHVPHILRSVEILGMMQSRSWNLASLNEFREYFKLKPHKTFKDINPDPQIAKQLERLYGHPDNVEIYPGIVVEAAKKPMKPGSGLCASYTTSRAVLSDAVALVRSDRFHTIDMTPQNLTNWGYNAANYDLDINHGCVIYKLILNAFPNHFSKNSVYAHYPMVIPDKNKPILRELGRDGLYSWERPIAKSAAISQPSGAIGAAALSDSAKFDSLWAKRSTRFGAPSTPAKAQLPLAEVVLKNDKWQPDTTKWYTESIERLWKEKQYELGGAQQIDIVKDVLNPAHVGYIETVLGIPLTEKAKEHHGHQGLLSLLGEVFDHAFGRPKPSNLNASTRDGTHWLADAISSHLGRGSDSNQASFAKQAFADLAKAGDDVKAAAWQDVIPTSALMLNTLSRLSAQTCEFFLDAKEERRKVEAAAKASDSSTLSRYAQEATRLSSNITLAKKATTEVQVKEGWTSLSTTTVQPGQVVVVDVAKAQGEGLKGADSFRLDREESAYSMKAYGPEVDLAYKVTYICNTVITKILAQHPDINRAPGPQGQIKKIKDDFGTVMYLNAEESQYVPYPTSMKLRWKA